MYSSYSCNSLVTLHFQIKLTLKKRQQVTAVVLSLHCTLDAPGHLRSSGTQASVFSKFPGWFQCADKGGKYWCSGGAHSLNSDIKSGSFALQSSAPQPSWHQGPVLWKIIFPWTGGGGEWFHDDSSALHLLYTLFLLLLHCNIKWNNYTTHQNAEPAGALSLFSLATHW